MMIGANARPSAAAGSSKCARALRNASGRSAISVSRSMKPVTCGTVSCGSIRPMNGSACTPTPNAKSSSSAHRNSGIDISTIDARSIAMPPAERRAPNISSPPPSPSRIPSGSPSASSSSVVGSAPSDQLGHRLMEVNRDPEVTANEVREPNLVLLGDRPVEPQVDPHRAELRLGGAGRERHRERVGRDDPQRDEQDERDEEQRRDGEQQPPQNGRSAGDHPRSVYACGTIQPFSYCRKCRRDWLAIDCTAWKSGMM